MFRFLKSLFIKPKTIHICKYEETVVSGSEQSYMNGKYDYCKGCGKLVSKFNIPLEHKKLTLFAKFAK
tara:strand:+ start:325 stop:528 length:204 start_codon:yes stop_codon:yes gene_type:complete